MATTSAIGHRTVKGVIRNRPRGLSRLFGPDPGAAAFSSSSLENASTLVSGEKGGHPKSDGAGLLWLVTFN
jgi:hypothetical protein